MSINKTSQAVDQFLKWQWKEDELYPITYREERAIFEKYQKYEEYTTRRAQAGDVEARKVLEYDPLS